MELPKEIPVPHWAQAMVGNYRRAAALPSSVTDEMIFARLEEVRGCEAEDISEAIAELKQEVENAKP